MTRPELDVAVEWAAKEGWNPGLHDADVFWNTDPQGFIGLFDGDGMVGSGSTISYNGDFGFKGFFIVKPEYRGKGAEDKLWYHLRDTMLARVKPEGAIGVNGVSAMQKYYAKSGYEFSHRNLRMEFKAINFEASRNVLRISRDDLEVFTYDKKCFGYDRAIFLKHWFSMKDSLALKYTENSEIKGFGVVRRCLSGFKIGPLFAQSFTVAEELFKSLSSYAEGKGESIFLDIPEVNKDAVRLAAKYNMQETSGTARMYYGKAPKLPYKEIYGVTTFELG